MSYQLTYFDTPGRAFMCRAALHHAGVEFQDNRLSFPEFMAAKKAGKYPLGVPILTLPDGQEIGESVAILRFAGKLGKLYPEDPAKALLVDSFVDLVMGAVNSAPQAKEEAEKKAAREAFMEGKLKVIFAGAEAFVEAHGSENFAVGDSFTIADLTLVFSVGMVLSGSFDHVPPSYVDQFPRLKAVTLKAQAHPVVTKWNEQVAANKAAAAAAADTAAPAAAE